MLTLTIISFVLLAGFTVWAARLAGAVPSSYSALGTLMDYYYPEAQVNLWSVVTVTAAFNMVPPMIEAGDGSMVQCLGFFAPIYLIIVGLTPKWEQDRKQLWIHRIGAGISAILALLWLTIIREDLGLTFVAMVAALVAGTASCAW